MNRTDEELAPDSSTAQALARARAAIYQATNKSAKGQYGAVQDPPAGGVE